MTPVQVFLVVVGLIIIALSYIISENFLDKRAKKQTSESKESYQLTEDETHHIQKKIDEILNIEIEYAIDQVREKLSKMSNEKIIVMNEFSDQILEKIEQNHSEVIFLYNMLNDKEEAMKERERIPLKASTKKESHHTVYENTEKDIKKSKKQNSSKAITLDRPIDYGKELNQEDIKDQELAKQKVLQLYSEGKSVMEIARLLEIGQGEIKLIIELERGIKNEA